MIIAKTSTAIPASKGREHFLPSFRSLGTILILLLLGELLAFMLTLVSASSLVKFWPQLGLNSLFILWVGLLSLAILATLANHLDRMRAVNAGVGVFLIVVSSSLLVTWLDSLFSQGSVSSMPQDFDDLPFTLLKNSILAGLVTTVSLRYQYVQYLRRLQARAESSARLEALQSRMKPHFLFNSLNTIAGLIVRNPKLAEELILDLADLFRAILRKDNRVSTIEDELLLSRQYLNIEQLRLGERLRVLWKLDDDLLGAAIPPISLQPLIENAIHHGVEASPAGGVLEISCQPHKKNMILLAIRNSLPEQAGSSDRTGNRIALDNLRLRLQSWFGERGKLMVSMAEGFYQARIIIPYTTKRSHEDHAG